MSRTFVQALHLMDCLLREHMLQKTHAFCPWPPITPSTPKMAINPQRPPIAAQTPTPAPNAMIPPLTAFIHRNLFINPFTLSSPPAFLTPSSPPSQSPRASCSSPSSPTPSTAQSQSPPPQQPHTAAARLCSPERGTRGKRSRRRKEWRVAGRCASRWRRGCGDGEERGVMGRRGGWGRWSRRGRGWRRR